MIRSLGISAPASFRQVVNRSMVQASSWVTTPAGTRPGHQAMPGSRMPPSQVEPLPSRKGPAEPPASPSISHGPLSLVKKTRVLRSKPSRAGVEHLAHAPVDLFDHVAIQAAAAAAAERARGKQRHVRKGVGQIEEERGPLMAGDKLHGLFGIAAGERGLVGGALDLLFVAIQRCRPPLGLLIEPTRQPLAVRRG